VIVVIVTEYYAVLVENKLKAFNILFNNYYIINNDNQKKDNSIYILSKRNYQSISNRWTVFNLVFNIPINIKIFN